MVATAGQCVNSASSAIAGRTSSQPWMAAVRRFMGGPGIPLRVFHGERVSVRGGRGLESVIGQ